MNSAISSLRILPAADSALRSSVNSSGGESGEGSPEFLDVLHSALDDMQNLQGAAESKVAGVLDGTGTDVHTALIAVEKADLSFQLMMQVRNKIVSAYQEISRMQF
ncbi:MAG TPA: flagellar hook-basal body complex protein FliE [Terriglobales bacterium]|nr:flagellar hook-basal body complex protein FliE [Terriglobales bacterium]